MKKIFCTVAVLGLLAGCSNEPEVVEEDTVLADTEVNDTALETDATTAWDTNGDELFQETEYTAVGETFGNWDLDSDGGLTSEEFNTGWTNQGWSDSEGAFASFDNNGDGLLDNDEFFSNEEWAEWDADSNGVLDNNEWAY